MIGYRPQKKKKKTKHHMTEVYNNVFCFLWMEFIFNNVTVTRRKIYDKDRDVECDN